MSEIASKSVVDDELGENFFNLQVPDENTVVSDNSLKTTTSIDPLNQQVDPIAFELKHPADINNPKPLPRYLEILPEGKCVCEASLQLGVCGRIIYYSSTNKTHVITISCKTKEVNIREKNEVYSMLGAQYNVINKVVKYPIDCVVTHSITHKNQFIIYLHDSKSLMIWDMYLPDLSVHPNDTKNFVLQVPCFQMIYKGKKR